AGLYGSGRVAARPTTVTVSDAGAGTVCTCTADAGPARKRPPTVATPVMNATRRRAHSTPRGVIDLAAPPSPSPARLHEPTASSLFQRRKARVVMNRTVGSPLAPCYPGDHIAGPQINAR